MGSDNGTEFTSNAILSWSELAEVEWRYITLGKSMQNTFIEIFSGRVRGEFPNEAQFTTLAQARVALSIWQADYNGLGRIRNGTGDAHAFCCHLPTAP